jgi:hypothetical protein
MPWLFGKVMERGVRDPPVELRTDRICSLTFAACTLVALVVGAILLLRSRPRTSNDSVALSEGSGSPIAFDAGMAAEGAEVLHDSEAPSPGATNHVLAELRKGLDDAYGTTDGGKALTCLKEQHNIGSLLEQHNISSLLALQRKLGDAQFVVDPVCALFLRQLLRIDNHRAKEAEETRKAEDEEQQKEKEKPRAATRLLEVRGGALGSSVCVQVWWRVVRVCERVCGGLLPHSGV